jgi:hypothetical protein
VLNSTFPRPTAKIYQFPLQAREPQERRKLAQQAVVAQYLIISPDVVPTGAWYHDAAIKEDDRGRKG